MSKRKVMKVVTKSYTQVEYSFGIRFDGPDVGPNVPMTFIIDPLMDLVNGGRIHSLASFFIEEFGIDSIPKDFKKDVPFICNKMNLDGATPNDIIWYSLIVRELYEQGDRFPSVYKAYKVENKKIEDAMQFLKDAR